MRTILLLIVLAILAGAVPAAAQSGQWGSEGFYSNPRHYNPRVWGHGDHYSSYGHSGRSYRTPYGYGGHGRSQRHGNNAWHGVAEVIRAGTPIAITAIRERRERRVIREEEVREAYIREDKGGGQKYYYQPQPTNVIQINDPVVVIAEPSREQGEKKAEHQKEVQPSDPDTITIWNATTTKVWVELREKTKTEPIRDYRVVSQGREEVWTLDAGKNCPNFLRPKETETTRQYYRFSALVPQLAEGTSVDVGYQRGNIRAKPHYGGGWKILEIPQKGGE